MGHASPIMRLQYTYKKLFGKSWGSNFATNSFAAPYFCKCGKHKLGDKIRNKVFSWIKIP